MLEPKTTDPAHILSSIRNKGVNLWSDNGRLRYEGPKGALTPEDLARLRALKGEIVRLLELSRVRQDVRVGHASRSRLQRAPLAFTQLAHWNSHDLGGRPSTRIIASATRLRGRLDTAALQDTLSFVVGRHDALRSCLVVEEGEPIQEVRGSNDTLRVEDLRGIPETSRDSEVSRFVRQLITEPVDVTHDSLFESRLLRLQNDEHVLVLAMEHTISDMFSMDIVCRELFDAYTRAVTNQLIAMPAVPVQFLEFSASQRALHDSWTMKYGAQWREHLLADQRLRFPSDSTLSSGEIRSGWGSVSIRIDRDCKRALAEWCRLRRNTLPMAMFSAFSALMLRWCDAQHAIFRYQSDGRTNNDVQNTVGFFASALYLHVQILENDTFGSLVQRITGEYCQSYERADYGYFSAQVPRPQFTRNPLFNWIPQGCRRPMCPLSGTPQAVTCSPVEFEQAVLASFELDIEPVLLLFDAGEEITCELRFPKARVSARTMKAFGRRLLQFIRAMLARPDALVTEIYPPISTVSGPGAH